MRQRVESVIYTTIPSQFQTNGAVDWVALALYCEANKTNASVRNTTLDVLRLGFFYTVAGGNLGDL